MIHDQIKADLKDAMRAKDAVKMTTLRGLLAAFTNELVAQKKNLTNRSRMKLRSRLSAEGLNNAKMR